MASFQYKARDASGNAVSGQLEATSQAAAADILKQRRYIPLSIEAVVTTQSSGSVALWQTRVSLTELIIFSRQMYSLMKAGIPIIRAIKSLAESTGSPRLRQVMTDLASELENGRSLSVAMAN
ncbi:type II secretion system F family protein, partial [Arsukibacterium sp.]|uniref:type II secretion system F family protein n=1 Tax=Arsukibacterium sp. TaxID=1977258 RepID=UPI00299DDEB7